MGGLMKQCSVIIPAHNEEALIGNCIESILANQQTFEGELEIIVVANACTDSTTEIAKNYNEVKVIETEQKGKPNALNLGDSAASYFPRVYVDGDLVLSNNVVHELTKDLSDKNIKITSPRLMIDVAKIKNKLIKNHYEFWLSLPHIKDFLVGGGVYAINRKSRKAFDKFPDILSDDGYIKALFDEKERKINKNCFMYMHTPNKIEDMIYQRIRWTAGELELKNKYPHLFHKRENYYKNIVKHIINEGLNEPTKLLTHFIIYFAGKVGGRLKYYFGDMNYWNRIQRP